MVLPVNAARNANPNANNVHHQIVNPNEEKRRNLHAILERLMQVS